MESFVSFWEEVKEEGAVSADAMTGTAVVIITDIGDGGEDGVLDAGALVITGGDDSLSGTTVIMTSMRRQSPPQITSS